MPEQQAGLTPDEAEIFARGLFFLANVDEMDPREEKLIREFIEESDAPIKYEELGKTSFSILEAAQMLTTSYMRRIFLKTAILLVRADGKYSPQEREALGLMADALGVSNAEFGALEQEAEGASFA
jgi:tellurite resistance protein